jgi:hypothetical protein
MLVDRVDRALAQPFRVLQILRCIRDVEEVGEPPALVDRKVRDGGGKGVLTNVAFAGTLSFADGGDRLSMRAP